MPQVVMRDAIRADLFARSIKSLLAFANAENFGFQRIAWSFAMHSLKQCARIWNQWNTPQFPILGAGVGIAADNDFTRLKIHIPPVYLTSFPFPPAGKCQASCKIGAAD